MCAEEKQAKSEHSFSRFPLSFFAVRIFQFISSSSSENDSCSAFGQNLLLLLFCGRTAAHPPVAAPSSIILEMKKPKNGQAWRGGMNI